MEERHPLAKFDPGRLARYEKENYVAYYQKRWLKLMRASVGMVKEAFNLSLRQAIYAAYLVARAEIAFAPFPENDVPRAEDFMRRFFAYVGEVHHLVFDIEQAARLQIDWWIVHRNIFGQANNQELVDALANSYALTFGVEPARVHPAASYRAKGMYYSDLWVNEGCQPGSRLLEQEEELLTKSYIELKSALMTMIDERRDEYSRDLLTSG